MSKARRQSNEQLEARLAALEPLLPVEGSWASSLLFGNDTFGNGGMSTTSVAYAKYIKIGKLVHVTFEATFTHTGNTNGTGLLITGLPFSPETATFIGGSGTIFHVQSTGAAALNGLNTHGIASWWISDGPWTIIAAAPSGTSGTTTVRGFATYIATN